MTATCDLCGRPMGGQAYICARCAEVLDGALTQIASLAGDVVDEIARLARHGERGGRAQGHPLPVDLAAVQRASEVANTVSTWARHVAETRGLEVDGPGLGEVAGWLAGHVEWLSHQPEAPEAHRDLTEAAGQLRRLVDGPTPRWYAGPCGAALDAGPCETDLYASPGARTVRCPGCGAQHDAADRKEWLLDVARNHLAHAELIARAVTALGRECTSSMIRNYADRGRLVAHGTMASGSPAYRVGDVLDLLDERDEKDAERARRLATVAERKANRQKEGSAA